MGVLRDIESDRFRVVVGVGCLLFFVVLILVGVCFCYFLVVCFGFDIIGFMIWVVV